MSLPAGECLNLLSDGRVLDTGGSAVGNVATNIAAIYAPASNSWTQVASMTYPRLGHDSWLAWVEA